MTILLWYTYFTTIHLKLDLSISITTEYFGFSKLSIQCSNYGSAHYHIPLMHYALYHHYIIVVMIQRDTDVSTTRHHDGTRKLYSVHG